MKKILYIIILFSGSLLFSCKSAQKAQKEPDNASATTTSQADKKASLSTLQYGYTFFEATKQKILGNLRVATALFQKCISMNKTIADPYYELASIYNFSGQYDDAQTMAEKSVELDPKNTWYRQQYAELLSNNSKYKKAVEQLQTLVKQEPKNPDYYYLLAKNYTFQKNYKSAVAALNQLEKITGPNEQTTIRKEKLYLQMGDTDKAVAELKALIKTNPDNVKYAGMLGDLYMTTGQEDKAYQIYQNILKSHPDDPVIHLSLSQYYESKGDDAKSFDEIKKAFASKDLDVDMKVKILLSYYNLSAKNDSIKEKAFELAKILVKTDSTSAQAYTAYGDFLNQDNQYKKARDEYRKALTITKSKFPIWQQVLLLDNRLSDYKSMLKESNNALNYFPNQAIIYFFNGLANSQLKNYSNAINSFKMARDLTPENKELRQEIISSMADAYYQEGDLKKSFETFDEGIKLYPKNSTILNNYAYYLSVHKQNLTKADSMAAVVNKISPNEANFLDTYAWVKFQQGKFDQANEWEDKALSNGGDTSGLILEHKGDILYKLGKITEAVSYWEKAKKQGGASKLIDKKITDKKFYEE